MSINLPVTKSSQELISNIGTTSTLLGRGLAAIHNKQLLIADQDKHYRQARDVYDRITHFGLERRFDPKNLPKPGTQLDLFANEPSDPLQPLIDQIYQLIDVFRRLKRLAEEGYGKAYFVLARIYWGGQGVEKDIELNDYFSKKSFAWLTNHNRLNDPEIWRDLGWTYKNGRGVEQDNEQAVYWYRKAAEQGDGISQTHLGYIYSNGQDVEQAVNWYRKAAEQGNALGQLSLGKMFRVGLGKR